MIAELVGTPSISSVEPELDTSNRGVVDLVAAWAESAAMSVEVRDVPSRPGKHNVLARLGGEGPAALLLAGHTDTVPYDDGAWSSDPFAVTERDGQLYGLGTADMKSFLALALEAIASFEPRSFRRPIVLLGTADEESSMSGARALVDAGEPLAERAILGEPTSLVPIRAHKGILMERVRLVGRSGHSSDPSLGVSALDGMHAVIGRLLDYRARLALRRDPEFDVPYPTLNLGRVHGGDAPNRICATCELSLDVRLLPGMSLDETHAEIDREVRDAVRASGLALEVDTAPLFDGVPAYAADARSLWVRELEQETGATAGTVAFGTEAPFLRALGVETVVLGPGSIDVAHKPDEHVPVASLAKTVELLRHLVQRHCVSP